MDIEISKYSIKKSYFEYSVLCYYSCLYKYVCSLDNNVKTQNVHRKKSGMTCIKFSIHLLSGVIVNLHSLSSYV